MTPLAPHLSAFLREHLPRDRACSRHTCETYAYAFQLLLCFAAQRCATSPSSLTLEQLDASLVLAFLEHLETARGNAPRTRNAATRRKPELPSPALLGQGVSGVSNGPAVQPRSWR